MLTELRARLVLALSIGLLCSPLHAATINIDTFLTGENAGTAVTAVLVLSQNGNDVDFTLSNTVGNLGAAADSSTFISDLGFSYDGTLSPSQFTNFSGIGQSIDGNDFSIDPNGNFQGGYDFFLELGFPTSGRGGGAQRFLDGESVSWTITNVLLDDFLGAVSGTGPDVLAAAHIQSLLSGGSTTYGGTAVVPLPAAAWLFLTCLAGLFGMKRLKASSQS